MGCTTSLPTVHTSVNIVGKCKQHLLLIRSAMENRQKFSHTQAAYIKSLRNIGIALEHFSDGVITFDMHSSDEANNYSNIDLLKTGPLIPGNTSPNQNSTDLNHGDPTPVANTSVSALETSSLECSDPFPFSNAESTTDILASSLNAALRFGKTDSHPADSPERDDPEKISSSPSSDLVNTSWLSVDIFTPSYVPYHIQEDKEHTIKWVGWTEHRKGYEERIEDQMPDLEEVKDEAYHVYNEIFNPEVVDNEAKLDYEEAERMPNLEVAGLIENETQSDEQVCQNDWSNRMKEISLLDAENSPTISQESLMSPNLMMNDDSDHMTKQILETDALLFPKVLKVKDVDIRKSEKENDVVPAIQWRNLKEMGRCLREHFDEAYMSGEGVSRVLTSEFDHEKKGSSRALNAMKSYRSKRTPLAMESDFEEIEWNKARNQATTLQRLYAWEEKLYNEVKESEFIRRSLDYKCRQLNDFIAADADSMVIDQIKLTRKELDAQLFVLLKAVQVASMKIQDIAFNELRPQLYELLIELKKMWKILSKCHSAQERVALMIDAFKVKHVDEIDKKHRDATLKLEHELKDWQSHLVYLHQFEKKYIDDLYAWVKVCCETNQEEYIDGEESQWTRTPIFSLLKEWKYALLSRDVYQNKVVDNIKCFVSAIQSLEQIQLHELKLRQQAEMSSRKSNKKTISFKRVDSSSRWSVRGTAIKELQEINTLKLLKKHLPELFKSMFTLAEVSRKMYEDIQQKAESQSVISKEEEALL